MITPSLENFGALKILGAARLGNLSVSSSTNLSRSLTDLQINYIDTAPSYHNSEQRIGTYNRKFTSTLNIFTKFGRGLEKLDPGSLENSIDKSLSILKSEQVFRLSIHNRSTNDVSDDVFNKKLELKIKGKINKFGWCGDWKN